GDAIRAEAHLLRGQRQRFTPATARMLGAGVEQDADAPAGIWEVTVPGTEYERLPGVRSREAGQHPEGRRLPGAVPAEEPGDRSRLDAERDVPDDRSPAEPFGEILGFDHAASVAGAGASRLG